MAGEFISNNVFDSGLSYLTTNGETVYITSQVATTVAEAQTTYSLGQKTGATVGSVGDATGNGRSVTISAINDGTVDGNGTATHWALTKDSATAELLATGPLASSQVVTSGNTFTLTAIEIIIRDATVT